MYWGTKRHYFQPWKSTMRRQNRISLSFCHWLFTLSMGLKILSTSNSWTIIIRRIKPTNRTDKKSKRAKISGLLNQVSLVIGEMELLSVRPLTKLKPLWSKRKNIKMEIGRPISSNNIWISQCFTVRENLTFVILCWLHA